MIWQLFLNVAKAFTVITLFVHFWFVPENVAARCCATRIFLYFRKVYKRICSPKNRQQ
jgi:hypothetical protein